MISLNVSEELAWRHEQANHFCYNILSRFIVWSSFEQVEYNNFVPGLIIKCDNTSFNYIGMIERDLKKYAINTLFNIKEYKHSIQISLKKEYIDKIEELEILLKIRNIL